MNPGDSVCVYYHDPEDLDGSKLRAQGRGKPTTPSGGKGKPGPGKGKGKDPKPEASADQIAEWLQIYQKFGDHQKYSQPSWDTWKITRSSEKRAIERIKGFGKSSTTDPKQGATSSKLKD